MDLFKSLIKALGQRGEEVKGETPYGARGRSKIAVLMLGWALLLLGMVGLLLPLLPGIPFFIAGLVVLSREYEWARGLLERGRRLIPALSGKLQQLWRAAGLGTSQSPQD